MYFTGGGGGGHEDLCALTGNGINYVVYWTYWYWFETLTSGTYRFYFTLFTSWIWIRTLHADPRPQYGSGTLVVSVNKYTFFVMWIMF